MMLQFNMTYFLDHQYNHKISIIKYIDVSQMMAIKHHFISVNLSNKSPIQRENIDGYSINKLKLKY